MNNCLILLTNYYPFHKGEEYLESEIEHLSKNYRQIYIISTMVSNEMKQTRKVPHNASVLPIGIKHSPLGKLNMVFHQFRKVSKDQDKRQMITVDSNGKMLNKLYCYYFESRAMDVYKNVENMLNKFDFEQYDSITLYSYWLYITARVAVELKTNYFKTRNIYAISRAHRYDLYEYAAPLRYLPERGYLLNSLDAIYPCSQDGVDALYQTYPEYKDKIRVERLGTISTNVLSNITNDKLHIVSCSVIRKVKRLDLLIEALVELEKRNITFSWTHIGDGPEYHNIKKLAAKKLNSENYHFTGFMTNKDVLNWYKENAVTVFVNLSSSEGVPVAIMEAMSMGIPILATNVGGTQEIVDNNINGYVLEKDCTKFQVIDYLVRFLKLNKGEYTDMSNSSLSIWNERSNANVLYSDFSEQLAKNGQSFENKLLQG